MLDPIINFFTWIFQMIGKGIGIVIAWLLWPFLLAAAWYRKRGMILKAVVGALLLGLVALYGYFFWQSTVWTNFDPNYATAYSRGAQSASAGDLVVSTATTTGTGTETDSGTAGEGDVKSCTRSAITDVTADLTDYNVNQNAWISSMLLYKLGLFGVRWDLTPFFDNKASFQRGVHQAVRRTGIELVDRLGRIRGSSQIDPNLQDARGSLQFDESTWYIGFNPPGPKTPTPSFYRSAIADLNVYNEKLAACNATFDARADNLVQFLDRIASDIGSTSDILRERSESHNGGWFDTRADDRFWFSYGQLYGYYGIIVATRADFHDVITSRGLVPLWDRLESQFRSALAVQPFIISNGREDGWVMPTHLATMGFYVLRIRTNMVEIRSVLDR